MSIETLNLNGDHNPAWMAVEWLRKCCVRQRLDPNTVKSYSDLDQVIEKTALARVFPLSTVRWECLTPAETDLIKTGQINQIKKIAIIDIDGVWTSPWPTIQKFLEGIGQPGKPFWPNLRQTIEDNKPDWTTLKPLAEIERHVDKVIFWTSRLIPQQDNWFGSTVWPQEETFGKHGALDAFPFLTPQTVVKLEKRNRLSRKDAGKRTVLAGEIKGFFCTGLKKIVRTIETLTDEKQKNGDPYVVYIGSSLFDLYRFQQIINCLKKEGMPFDRTVFCTNKRLVL